MQELSFSAEYRTPIKSGISFHPTDLLPISIPAGVWYVGTSERRQLYSYDDDLFQLVTVDPLLLATRATIDLSGGQCAILFGSTVVITVIDGVFSSAVFDGLHTYGAVPGLEFWRGPFRFATFSANGEIDARDFTESSVAPVSADNIALMSGSQWLCSIGQSGVTAQSFKEND